VTWLWTERSGRGGCVDERRLAIAERTRRRDVYIPRCHSDGRYTKEQCHNATGYCWCVTTDGKPIPGSSVHGRQHNCAAYYSGTNLTHLLAHARYAQIALLPYFRSECDIAGVIGQRSHFIALTVMHLRYHMRTQICRQKFDFRAAASVIYN